MKAFQSHRSALPPADRLSIESFMAVRDSFSVAVARAQEVTQCFPDYWFGWLVYGDYLVHRAPILGFRVSDAGPVLERALQLNPRLTPAWEHLMRCTARAATPREQVAASSRPWPGWGPARLWRERKGSTSCCNSDWWLAWRKRVARPTGR